MIQYLGVRPGYVEVFPFSRMEFVGYLAFVNTQVSWDLENFNQGPRPSFLCIREREGRQIKKSHKYDE